MEKVLDADILIICSYNAARNSKQKALIESLLLTGKPTIIIALRDLDDSDYSPKANLLINTYSPTEPSLKVACDKIRKYQ